MKRVIAYYQTFRPLQQDIEKYVTDIFISSIHFGDDNIHLNDNSPYDEIFDDMWDQCKSISSFVKMGLMVGGAGGAYEKLFSNFAINYPLLIELFKKKPWITMVNFDVEETCSIDKLMFLLKLFNRDLPYVSISFAPVAFAMTSSSAIGMGGFKYGDLYKRCFLYGISVDFFIQCYGGNQNMTIIEQIYNTWGFKKIIIGCLWDEFDSQFTSNIIKKYSNINGVFIWEYGTVSDDWAPEASKAVGNS